MAMKTPQASRLTRFTRLKRFIQHTFVWRLNYKRAFNDTCLSAVQTAVKACEANSDTQVCVIAEHTLPYSYIHRQLTAYDRALTLFGKHRVWDTAHNTGVLIYINWVEHSVQIIADRGLLGAVVQDQWDAWASRIRSACASGQYQTGLIDTVNDMALVFAKVMPREPHAASHAHQNTVGDMPIVL